MVKAAKAAMVGEEDVEVEEARLVCRHVRSERGVRLCVMLLGGFRYRI